MRSISMRTALHAGSRVHIGLTLSSATIGAIQV